MSGYIAAKNRGQQAEPFWRSGTVPQSARPLRVFFSRAIRAFGIALLLSMLPRLLLFVQMSTSLVAWRWQFDYDEGINLNATLQLASLHNIYQHNGPGGFISAPYSPLFFLINAPITWITGPQFASGRIISLLSTLLIAFLLAYTVHKVTEVWAAGLAAGALWLSASPVIVWSAFYKQDMPALALGLAGFACALGYVPATVGKAIKKSGYPPAVSRALKQQYRPIYLAAIFFALSFWTKQSSISAAVAVVLWLLLRDVHAGKRLILSLIVLVVAPFVYVNSLLHGTLWEHMVGYHAMPTERGRLDWMLRPLWAEYTPLILLAALALCGALGAFLLSPGPAGLSSRAWNLQALFAGPWVPATLYALVGGASTLAQSGYEGANFNHLFDAILPACLLAGLSAGWLWKQIEPGLTVTEAGNVSAISEKRYYKHKGRDRGEVWVWASIGAAFVCVLLTWQVATFKDPQGWFYNPWPNSATDQQMRYLHDLVAHTPGAVYSEDAYLLLSTGHQVTYDDASTFVPLEKLGRWDDSSFVEALRKRTIRMVLLTHSSPRLTRRIREALHTGYRMKPYGPMDVYVAANP